MKIDGKIREKAVELRPYSLKELEEIFKMYANYSSVNSKYSKKYLENAICSTIEQSFIGVEQEAIEQIFENIIEDKQFSEIVFHYCLYAKALKDTQIEWGNKNIEKYCYCNNMFSIICNQFLMK